MTTTHDAPAQPTTTDKGVPAFATQCPACGCQSFVRGEGCSICDYLVEEIATDNLAAA